MAYYRIALTGHARFSAGDAAAHTYLQLKAMGHGVELLDPAVVPGIFDAEGNLDRTAAAPFLETFDPACVACAHDSVEDILAACERSGKGQDEPIRHVVVFGYIGPDNFGDELIFSLIAANVRKRYPGSYVSAIGHVPDRTIARHGVASVTPPMKAELFAQLAGASALVFMAGIMFDEPFKDWTSGPIDLYLNPHSEIAGQTACCLMAYQQGVPAVFLGVGAGPLANADACKLVEMASLTKPLYLPRDRHTAQLLENAGVDRSLIQVKADLAFSIERPERCDAWERWKEESGLADAPFLSASFRDHRTCGEGLADAMATLFDHAFETKGWRTVFLDFAPEDHTVHERIAGRMRHAEEALFFGLTDDFDSTVAALSQAQASVAMRLHCSIVSNALGIPSIGIDYNDKVEALYDAMDARAFLLEPDCSARRATATFDALMQDDAAAERVRTQAAALREQALDAFETFFETIDAADVPRASTRLYVRDVSIAQQELERERERCAHLETELAATRARCEELVASPTWKAGRAIGALPRAIKRIAGRA